MYFLTRNNKPKKIIFLMENLVRQPQTSISAEGLEALPSSRREREKCLNSLGASQST
jgi:hypothetical protein